MIRHGATTKLGRKSTEKRAFCLLAPKGVLIGVESSKSCFYCGHLLATFQICDELPVGVHKWVWYVGSKIYASVDKSFSFWVQFWCPVWQTKIIQNLSFIWEIRQAKCKYHARRRLRRCCGSVGFDEDTAWQEARTSYLNHESIYTAPYSNCWGSMHTLPMYKVIAPSVSKQQKQTQNITKQSKSHRITSHMFTSLGFICFKFRTEEPNGWHTVWYCPPSQLETRFSSSSKRLGTERQTHASCDSISWGGNAVRSAVENLGSASLSDLMFFNSLRLLTKKPKSATSWWTGQRMETLKRVKGPRLVLFKKTQEPFLVKSPIALGLYPAAHSILRSRRITDLQLHGSLQFKAFQSIHVKHEEPGQSGWAHRPSCRSL